MVDVMGQTPEEFEQMLNDQIAAAQMKANAIKALVERLSSARVSGMDSNQDVEVEVNSDGRMTKISIDENAMRGSAEDLERSVMEAYADAGRNMATFVRERVSQDVKDEGGAIEAYAATVEPVLNSLGR
ncbi:YbaB/EbfC family nucleoid-associated protein [Schaalia odontolytica]|jgi:putative cytoplasmic protein|nr:YbaB/EbfC family nucleoid-associated protein [Schaalia odontolytica]WMS28064.1 YbaB/EbfC family nucleoid-associated protein [Schaalia odontolytica]